MLMPTRKLIHWTVSGQGKEGERSWVFKSERVVWLLALHWLGSAVVNVVKWAQNDRAPGVLGGLH